MDKTKKNTFASGLGFILAAAGSAIGLGNLWGFPFKTSNNGGAAFVFFYILSVIIIGVITMIAEIWIGRRAQANTITAYKGVNKFMGFIGLLAIVLPFLIITYYGVLGGYTVKYAVSSFSCNDGILGSFSVTTWEVILCTAVFLGLALIVVMAGVKEGIEKASKVLMPILFLILVGIVIYCLTLGDGVKDGLKKYLQPDFYAFFHDEAGNLSFKGLLAAMGQSFYSLSLGMGIMVAYGSYTGKEVKVGKSVAMICIFDTLIALLAGLAIFPAIGALMPDSLNSKGGVGLLFAVLPAVFAKMGTVGMFVSFFFFSMVVIAAVTSVISLLEVSTQFVVQKFKLSRKVSVAVVALLTFLISIPVGMSLGKVAICEQEGINLFGFDMLTFFDEATNSVLMPVVAFAGCVTVGWLIGKPTFNPVKTAEALKADGLELGGFGVVFAVIVKYITPVLILALDVAGVITNVTANPKYWYVVGFALILIGLSAVIYFVFLKDKYTGTNADEFALLENKNKIVEEK